MNIKSKKTKAFNVHFPSCQMDMDYSDGRRLGK